MMEKLKFDQRLVIDGQELSKKYIQSLSKQERLDIVDPIFQLLRHSGFIYPDNNLKLNKSYQRIKDYEPNLNESNVYNNSSIGTDICKYFCKSFYSATDSKKITMLDVFNDDSKLKRLIKNRLGLDWLDADERGPGVNESFNLSFKMIIQGMRSMRLVSSISMFKPEIAKYVCMKYSNEGELVGDYSAGFGGRLLGAMSCGRRYVGTDPLTTNELESMARFFKFKHSNYKLINTGSEHFKGEENSVDLYWSSPPYYDLEYYSDDPSQAYVNGKDYFYDIYWRNTLDNIKYMLKPNKWFGLNVKEGYPMLPMAIEQFGPVEEKISLRTVRSHLTKSAGTTKLEYIYMFKNKP